MNATPFTTKTLRGKYRITKDIFVACYLDVLEATDKEIRTFLGLKRRSDALVPVGTRIFFDADAINKINVRRNQSLNIFSITVQRIEDLNGKPLHICTPIHRESRADLRAQARKDSEFPVRLMGSEAEFTAKGGSDKGLTLVCKTRRAMLSLVLNNLYDFKVTYKDREHKLSGEIKHIQYDWKTHQHTIGVYFPDLPQEEEIVLNLLLDPNYVIDVSGRQTVDTAQGKVSSED